MEMVVTFETAQELKKAGFPQPEFAPYQRWYNEKGIELTTDLILGNLVFMPWDGRIGGWLYENTPPTGEAFFAPNALKILSDLYNEPGVKISIDPDIDEAAEIAAKAWLEQREKKDKEG